MISLHGQWRNGRIEDVHSSKLTLRPCHFSGLGFFRFHSNWLIFRVQLLIYHRIKLTFQVDTTSGRWTQIREVNVKKSSLGSSNFAKLINVDIGRLKHGKMLQDSALALIMTLWFSHIIQSYPVHQCSVALITTMGDGGLWPFRMIGWSSWREGNSESRSSARWTTSEASSWRIFWWILKWWTTSMGKSRYQKKGVPISNGFWCVYQGNIIIFNLRYLYRCLAFFLKHGAPKSFHLQLFSKGIRWCFGSIFKPFELSHEVEKTSKWRWIVGANPLVPASQLLIRLFWDAHWLKTIQPKYSRPNRPVNVWFPYFPYSVLTPIMTGALAKLSIAQLGHINDHQCQTDRRFQQN